MVLTVSDHHAHEVEIVIQSSFSLLDSHGTNVPAEPTIASFAARESIHETDEGNQKEWVTQRPPCLFEVRTSQVNFAQKLFYPVFRNLRRIL